MTDIPLNTYIEWTAEDREHGFCPVPAGSVVTVWHIDGSVRTVNKPEGLNWDEVSLFPPITAYLVHELARETIVAWTVADGNSPISYLFTDRQRAEAWAKSCGERVVKLVEVDDD